MMNNFWKPVRSKAKPKSNSIFKLKPNSKPIKPFINLKPFHKPQNNRDRALIRHNPWGDKDKDGVINLFDCKPLNKRQQGWIKGKGWRATNDERKEAYKKLREAGVPAHAARTLRGWRPTRVKQVIEGKRSYSNVVQNTSTPPQHERDYKKKWRDSPKARESIARSREAYKEKRKELREKRKEERLRNPEFEDAQDLIEDKEEEEFETAQDYIDDD